jgi:hypothetical protein
MKFFALVLAMSAVSANAVGQEADEPDFQEVVDDLLGYPDDDANLEDIYENAVQILSSPYDLNKVSPDELRALHILNDTQIEIFYSLSGSARHADRYLRTAGHTGF